ncbi:MAG TPA: class A sortase [Lactobacillaceae bacterium]|jgi:sortase A
MKRTLWKLIVLLLVIGGFVGVFNQTLEHLFIRYTQPTIKIAKNATVGSYDWRDLKSLNIADVLAARLNNPKHTYAGLISIPDIGVNLPISLGISNESLSIGAGTLTKNQVMGTGNYSLASHFVQGSGNKDLLFSPIYYRGKVGQLIYLTDLKKVYVYKTYSVRVVPPNGISVTDVLANKKIVTLITCDYTAESGRVVMQGELSKVISWHATPDKIKNSFMQRFKLLNLAR